MKPLLRNGNIYKLPDSLSAFQQDLYVHLIDWKWKHITKKVGIYNYKGRQIPYDAILPASAHKDFPLIYPSVLPDLKQHLKQYPFKLHQHFNHMASSQAANVNLFLPILLHPKANDIFKQLKPDFQSLASDHLYKGFRIEYWDGNSKVQKGLLGDHSARSGTDSDIAIAYNNKENELCLWLIEHKLTEKEFTECGGYKSRNNNKANCNKSFADIINSKKLCYYHDVRKFNYWNITEANLAFFVNHNNHADCPFKKGMNQLWRNQLMALGLENNKTYKHVYFSVVHHPNNTALNNTIREYKELVGNNSKFSTFTSLNFIEAAGAFNDKMLNDWIKWYKELYKM